MKLLCLLLNNCSTFLPYGVLCGFFSAVGILMWKLAITIGVLCYVMLCYYVDYFRLFDSQ